MAKQKSKAGGIIVDVLIILLIIGLLGTAAYLLYKEFYPNNTPVLKMQVTQKDDTIDWNTLKAKNGDTVGWLTIEGTNIDTPVVQTNNNDTYLYTAFDGTNDECGTPFVDMDYHWEPRSRNTVIYGHSTMRSGVSVMFDDLLQYVNDPEFIKKNGAILYRRPPEMGGDGVYAIFAVITLEADTDYRRMDFGSEEEFLNYYASLKVASRVQTDVTVNAGDEILTLSTCIFNTGLNDGRLAIIAKRVQ